MAETKIYIDTNVYIDLFENRSDKLVPWGEFAFQLFKRMFDCKFRIIMSPEVLAELEKYNYEEEINDLIKQMEEKNKVDYVIVNKEDKINASKNKTISHFKDRLHYVLAQKAGAELFITRNWKDFCGLGDVPVLTPELV